MTVAVFSPQNNLNTRDFADLSAPLLYDMFKAHTEYPLHLAIQHLREDVVFLFLIEYNSQVCSIPLVYILHCFVFVYSLLGAMSNVTSKDINEVQIMHLMAISNYF